MDSHSPDEVKKSVRTYWMIGGALFVCTALTVAVAEVELVIPLAITIALIIAATKGSMVASIFMHLKSEKTWIYGSLILTVFFFLVLIFLPILTVSDGTGTPLKPPAPGISRGY
jgi:cytochrome c oxidase subunit IV